MSKVTPFLMFSSRLREAIDFYRTLFPDFVLHSEASDGSDGPMSSAEFTLGGQRLMAFEAPGDHFRFSDAFSLFVDCADQAEVDACWQKFLDAGATPVQCGWITDPFGVSWQIVPRRFMELMSDPDPEKVQAVAAAMMTMQKLDVAALEKAYATA